MYEEYDWRKLVKTPTEMRRLQDHQRKAKAEYKARVKACESKHLDTKLGPGKGPHLASLICLECGKWIKWLSKREYDRIAAQDQ